MTYRQIPLTLIEQLEQLPTALEARRSPVEQSRVGVTCIIRFSPTRRDETPLQAQPSNDAPTSISVTTQHNASTAFAPARRAAHLQTNTHLTVPQHHPAPLRQPSSSHQT